MNSGEEKNEGYQVKLTPIWSSVSERQIVNNL